MASKVDKQVYDKRETSNENIYNKITNRQLLNLNYELTKSCQTKRPFVVFVASCWDLLHAGHCIMLEDAKRQAKFKAGDRPVFLVAALHTDPTINRSGKNIPILSLDERRILISANKHVDWVLDYATEDDLLHILQDLNIDLRVLGSDWQGREYTGCQLKHIPVYFHHRNHSYSTSDLRKRVARAEANAT